MHDLRSMAAWDALGTDERATRDQIKAAYEAQKQFWAGYEPYDGIFDAIVRATRALP